jgi:hypothetical protein
MRKWNKEVRRGVIVTITRKLLISVLIVILALIIYVIWYTFPKKIDLHVEGIKYQLGDEHKEMAKPITVHIEGKMEKSLNGVTSFKGTIDFEGEQIPVPADQRELYITLGKDGQGLIVYADYSEAKPWVYSYGVIYTKDFNKVAFAVYKRNDADANSTGGGWSSGDGLMIAAPAMDRIEALDVSNELMEEHLLDGSPLK